MSWVDVAVPKKYSAWFKQNRTWPVKVAITARSATVLGGAPYQIHAVNSERVVAYRPVADSLLAVGEITKRGLLKPLSDSARHDLGAIRAAMFKTSYPAPLAYEMGNRELVHPGDCFNKHASAMIRRTHYIVRDEEARCAVCREAFE
jgi:hypothetical protein